MTVTIKLSDEQAAALQARAAEEGISVDDLLQRLAEEYAQARVVSSNESSRRPVWAIISERMNSVPSEVFEKLPLDGASEHDHYLYGSPKRNQ